MSSRSRPYLKLYVKDFLLDENVQVMDLEAIGAYVMLLMRMWLSKTPGVVPLDERVIARMASAEHCWDRIRDKIMPCFKRRGNSYVQKRMLAEYEAMVAEPKRKLGKELASAEQLDFAADLGVAGGRRDETREREGEARPANSGRSEKPDARHEDSFPSPASPSFPRTLPSSPPLPFRLSDADKIVGRTADGPVAERGEAQAANIVGVRKLLVELTDAKSVDRKSFDPQQVHLTLLKLNVADRDKWFKFAGWIWNTGPRDMRIVLFVIADAVSRNAGNEYAYFAIGSETRATTEARAREKIAEEDRVERAQQIKELFGGRA
jgi:uncharacterized protein YdaU (DUF1376 family)